MPDRTISGALTGHGRSQSGRQAGPGLAEPRPKVADRPVADGREWHVAVDLRDTLAEAGSGDTSRAVFLVDVLNHLADLQASRRPPSGNVSDTQRPDLTGSYTSGAEVSVSSVW
jgi:hypothetical protein